MILLRANEDQYNALNGWRNGNNEIQFVKDADGNWVIGLEVIDDPAFTEIREELLQLEQIEVPE